MGTVTLPLAFAAGIVTFASPCFLPIVPVFITYLAGSTPGNRVPVLDGALVVQSGSVQTRPVEQWQAGSVRQLGTRRRASRGKALANALAFSGAFTFVFAGIWAAISVIGWAAADFREPLRIGGGILLVAFGLFAAQIVKIPGADRARKNHDFPVGEPSPLRSAMLGLAFGAGWSPCIGPVLGLILGMALGQGTALAGLGLLLTFCAGITAAFVLVALGVHGVMSGVRKLSRYVKTFQIIGGLLMCVMGFLMIADLLAPLSSWVTII